MVESQLIFKSFFYHFYWAQKLRKYTVSIELTEPRVSYFAIRYDKHDNITWRSLTEPSNSSILEEETILDEETISDEEPHRWISHQSGLVHTSVAIQSNEDSIIFTEEDIKSQRNFVQNC